LVAGMKMNIDSGTTDIVTAVMNQQVGFLVPSFIVFFVVYFVACISMIVLIAKDKTILPKWLWILNPLVMKIVINVLGKLGTSAFFNGLACSNMSLGALIILLTWMIAIKRISNRNRFGNG
jgi:amino acid transporter